MAALFTDSISLLTILDKIIEKLMHKREMKFLNKEKILYYKPYGFHKGLSATHAIINLIDYIKSAIDNKQLICGVFIDLQKAFDIADHNVLLKKIQYFRIRCIAR